MSEPKPIASLSSGLLARKGAARPAMRRQLIGNNNGVAAAGSVQDDCGWNDMGYDMNYDVNPDPSTPMDYEHDHGYNPLANAVPEVKPEVKQQQDRIAEQLQVQAEALGVVEHEAPAAPVVPISVSRPVAQKASISKSRAAPGSKGKSAFTLRLDGDRHLKLRLACAISNKSAQQLVTAALDAFIDAMPEISTLAAQVPGKKSA